MSAEVDWLAADPPVQTRARGATPRDTLSDWLEPDTAAGDAARREEREAQRARVREANKPRKGDPRGSLAAGDAWLVADWLHSPEGGAVLGNVRFMAGKAAARVDADFKRPVIGVEPDVGQAWRDICRAFSWADPPAVYRAVAEVQGLEWVATQAQVAGL